MDSKLIQAFCLELAGTTEDLKWGSDLCFCIAGKMYAVLDISEACGGLSIKTTPELFEALTQLPGVAPAPYLARHKWIRLDHLNVLPWENLQEMIRESHALVKAKLPAKLRAQLSS